VGDSPIWIELSPASRALPILLVRDPGARAPGFMLSLAPRAEMDASLKRHNCKRNIKKPKDLKDEFC